MTGRIVRKYIALMTLLAFIVSGNAGGVSAQSLASAVTMPQPGALVDMSAPIQPPVLKGLKVYADEPFRLDFILDKGDATGYALHATSSNSALKLVSARLIKYFLASLTIPEKDLWVNLSPYEKDRIVPEAFGRTEMGRDLLAQDYLLKQLTASALYPEGETGKEFWKKVYAQAYAKYGTTDIPVDTFNKVWITPDRAVVYENGISGSAYIVESRLKVMLESDYLAAENAKSHTATSYPLPATSSHSADIAKDVLREVIIPVLEKEVNEGANFAPLRQVYQSLILAAWYKKKVMASLLSETYVDKNKVQGLQDNPLTPDAIWTRYVESFKKGAFNLVREEADPFTDEHIPRKYFSGGMDFAQGLAPVIEFHKAASMPRPFDASQAVMVSTRLKPAVSVTLKNVTREPVDPRAFEALASDLHERMANERVADALRTLVFRDADEDRPVFSAKDAARMAGTFRKTPARLLFLKDLLLYRDGKEHLFTPALALFLIEHSRLGEEAAVIEEIGQWTVLRDDRGARLISGGYAVSRMVAKTSMDLRSKVEWARQLKEEGFTSTQIGQMIYRGVVSDSARLQAERAGLRNRNIRRDGLEPLGRWRAQGQGAGTVNVADRDAFASWMERASREGDLQVLGEGLLQLRYLPEERSSPAKLFDLKTAGELLRMPDALVRLGWFSEILRANGYGIPLSVRDVREMVLAYSSRAQDSLPERVRYMAGIMRDGVRFLTPSTLKKAVLRGPSLFELRAAMPQLVEARVDPGDLSSPWLLTMSAVYNIIESLRPLSPEKVSLRIEQVRAERHKRSEALAVSPDLDTSELDLGEELDFRAFRGQIEELREQYQELGEARTSFMRRMLARQLLRLRWDGQPVFSPEQAAQWAASLTGYERTLFLRDLLFYGAVSSDSLDGLPDGVDAQRVFFMLVYEKLAERVSDSEVRLLASPQAVLEALEGAMPADEAGLVFEALARARYHNVKGSVLTLKSAMRLARLLKSGEEARHHRRLSRLLSAGLNPTLSADVLMMPLDEDAEILFLAQESQRHTPVRQLLKLFREVPRTAAGEKTVDIQDQSAWQDFRDALERAGENSLAQEAELRRLTITVRGQAVQVFTDDQAHRLAFKERVAEKMDVLKMFIEEFLKDGRTISRINEIVGPFIIYAKDSVPPRDEIAWALGERDWLGTSPLFNANQAWRLVWALRPDKKEQVRYLRGLRHPGSERPFFSGSDIVVAVTHAAPFARKQERIAALMSLRREGGGVLLVPSLVSSLVGREVLYERLTAFLAGTGWLRTKEGWWPLTGADLMAALSGDAMPDATVFRSVWERLRHTDLLPGQMLRMVAGRADFRRNLEQWLVGGEDMPEEYWRTKSDLLFGNRFRVSRRDDGGLDTDDITFLAGRLFPLEEASLSERIRLAAEADQALADELLAQQAAGQVPDDRSLRRLALSLSEGARRKAATLIHHALVGFFVRLDQWLRDNGARLERMRLDPSDIMDLVDRRISIYLWYRSEAGAAQLERNLSSVVKHAGYHIWLNRLDPLSRRIVMAEEALRLDPRRSEQDIRNYLLRRFDLKDIEQARSGRPASLNAAGEDEDGLQGVLPDEPTYSRLRDEEAVPADEEEGLFDEPVIRLRFDLGEGEHTFTGRGNTLRAAVAGIVARERRLQEALRQVIAEGGRGGFFMAGEADEIDPLGADAERELFGGEVLTVRRVPRDDAMADDTKGGIDLNPGRLELVSRESPGVPLRLRIAPDLVREYSSAPGLEPDIMSIAPVPSAAEFWGGGAGK